MRDFGTLLRQIAFGRGRNGKFRYPLGATQKMSSTAEASSLVRQLALPAPAADSTKAAISRAHRVLKTWTWNRVRDVWHADPRISVSADELDQLRNLVRERKYRRIGAGPAWDDTLGVKDRVAAIESELRECRALISSLTDLISSLADKGIGRPPLGVGRAAQEHDASPICRSKREGAEGQGMTPHPLEPVMRGADVVAFDRRNTAAKDAEADTFIDYAKRSNRKSRRRKHPSMRPLAPRADPRIADSKYSKQEL